MKKDWPTTVVSDVTGLLLTRSEKRKWCRKSSPLREPIRIGSTFRRRNVKFGIAIQSHVKTTTIVVFGVYQTQPTEVKRIAKCLAGVQCIFSRSSVMVIEHWRSLVLFVFWFWVVFRTELLSDSRSQNQASLYVSLLHRTDRSFHIARSCSEILLRTVTLFNLRAV